ncbi:MAG: alpha/beta hydrolase [Magnetospiraceae bacterium]
MFQSNFLNGPHAAPASQGPARQIVVLLHGYGADGDDLIALAPLLAEALPDAAFHAPHAPDPCEGAPFGRQWFSLEGYDPNMLRRDPERMGGIHELMLTGARSVSGAVDGYLDDLLSHYNLPESALALVGFSQGTMMALHVAPRRTEKMAAVLGYSGALLGAGSLQGEARQFPPIHLIHGAADDVVPVEAMGTAVTALTAAGFSVESHTRPGLAHGIDPAGAAVGLQFLRRHLAPEASAGS